MVKPVMIYGNSVLKKKCSDIHDSSAELEELIQSLWDTMASCGGVGLAATQVNSTYHVFVVNSKLMYDEMGDARREEYFKNDKGIMETFVNAKITSESEKKWNDTEACLSIPGINEQVERSWDITVEYLNGALKRQKKIFSGFTARVIQHEHDHVNGVLFIDRLSALKKKLYHKKLTKIKSGQFDVSYPYILNKKK